MRILGIDPGLATIGLGLIEAEKINELTAVDWLTLTTEKGTEMSQRLLEIRTDLQEYLKETKPDFVAIEKVYFSVNEKTAIDVAQARGVILSVLASEKIPFVEVGPMELKSTVTGDGRADKRQVQEMVMRTLRLEEIPTPDDAADALALAIYGAAHGSPVMPTQ